MNVLGSFSSSDIRKLGTALQGYVGIELSLLLGELLSAEPQLGILCFLGCRNIRKLGTALQGYVGIELSLLLGQLLSVKALGGRELLALLQAGSLLLS